VKTRLLFLGVVTPLGVLARPYWRRRLGLALQPRARSYWRPRRGGALRAEDLR
jgi:hypothetical protein